MTAPDMTLTPEERVEIIDMLVRRGVHVYTFYKSRRVVEIKYEGHRVVIKYADGGADAISAAHFSRRKFIAVL